MELSEKLRMLRLEAGRRRGLARALTQSEVVLAMRDLPAGGISQSYLSQLEQGQRVHLSARSRERLARFFGVHPGYLVSDDQPGDEPATLPFALSHPQAHHTLARLAAHPREPHIWPLVNHLLDLPEDEFRRFHELLTGSVPGAPFAPGRPAPATVER